MLPTSRRERLLVESVSNGKPEMPRKNTAIPSLCDVVTSLQGVMLAMKRIYRPKEEFLGCIPKEEKK